MGWHDGVIFPAVGDAHYFADCPRLLGLIQERSAPLPYPVKMDHDDGGEFVGAPTVRGRIPRQPAADLDGIGGWQKRYVCMRCVRRDNGLVDDWESEHRYVAAGDP